MPTTKIRERFGERMREIRKQKNLTQEELAEKAGLHYTYVGIVERGKKNVSLLNIEKIVKALKISLAEFFASFK